TISLSTLLSVQRLFQDQLGEFTAVAFAFHLQNETVVGTERVGAQGVDAHVGVVRALQPDRGARSGRLRHLQGDVRAGEARGVVVHVRDLHGDAVHLQRLFQHDLEAHETRRVQSARALTVDGLPDDERSARRVHVEILRVGLGHHPQISLDKPPNVESQVFNDVPDEGSRS
uniref:Uncharacterized protein n=1 Tax=Scleropages formosus TaxID=113540 RepID=A0A8C9UZ42_SCLFO